MNINNQIMNFYEFPTIHHISEVLPHIENYEEFRVLDKDDYKIVRYMVNTGATFDWCDNDPLGSAVRRECRGLAFNLKGELISRPFHKFFNCGEREETQSKLIDLSLSHYITHKLDGSMIRPLPLNGDYVLATKSGVTDVSMNAHEFIKDKPEYDSFIRDMITAGFTPMFEWTSRKNRIVIDYKEDNLIVIGVRNIIKGNYLLHDNIKELVEDYGVPCVEMIPSFSDIEDAIDHVAPLMNDEGVVIQFLSGHMLKIKADDYVLRHRSKDQITQEKNVISTILSEGVDDLIPLLTSEDSEKILSFQSRFYEEVDKTVSGMEIIFETGNKTYPDRKDFSLNYVKRHFSPSVASILFAMKSGTSARDFILNMIQKSCVSQTKIDENRWLFGYLCWNDFLCVEN
jgi:RNA ligase